LNKVFSSETEDEVVGTLYFSGMRTAQIFVNWSDESYRKMSTKISLWGKRGSIIADRQEMHVYLRDDADIPEGYQCGWNVQYTTDLTNPVWFYLRGEEYSAQLDHFVGCIENNRPNDNVNTFKDAAVTDKVIAMMMADADKGPAMTLFDLASAEKKAKGSFFSGITARH
jgi:predicted dehydrogenase